MPNTLLVVLVLVCLASEASATHASPAAPVAPPAFVPQDEVAATPTLVNGFGFDLPSGWVVHESSNGQVYLVDVRGPGTSVGDEPIVRLIVVPGTAATPDAVMSGIQQEIGATLDAAGLVSVPCTAPVRMLDGTPHTGLATTWMRAATRKLVTEAYAFVHEGDVVGVRLVVPQTAFSIHEPEVDALLASLVVHPFDADATRRDRLWGFAFDLPAMTPTLRQPVPDGEQLIYSWDAGQLEATVHILGFQSPMERARSMLRDLLEFLDTTARNEQGTLSEARRLVRWLGDGIVIGVSVKLISPRRALEIRSFAVPGERATLLLTLIVGDERLRDPLFGMLESVLASLSGEGGTRSARWKAEGFVLECGSVVELARTERELGAHLELILPWAPDGDPLVTLDVRRDLSPDDARASLPAHLRDVVASLDLDVHPGDPMPVGGHFLEADDGLGLAVDLDGVPHEIYAFASPLGEAVAFATLVTRTDEAPDALWIFANLMARVEPASESSQEVAPTR